MTQQLHYWEAEQFYLKNERILSRLYKLENVGPLFLDHN